MEILPTLLDCTHIGGRSGIFTHFIRLFSYRRAKWKFYPLY